MSDDDLTGVGDDAGLSADDVDSGATSLDAGAAGAGGDGDGDLDSAGDGSESFDMTAAVSGMAAGGEGPHGLLGGVEEMAHGAGDMVGGVAGAMWGGARLAGDSAAAAWHTLRGDHAAVEQDYAAADRAAADGRASWSEAGQGVQEVEHGLGL